MADVPALLTVTTLGRFAVYRDRQQLSGENWNRRKVRSLFKLLVSAEQHRLHREQIQEMLWPSSTSEQAANSFGKTLYLLRRALEPELAVGKGSLSTYISLDHDTTVLVPENIKIDADLFELSVKELQISLGRHKEGNQDNQLLSEFDRALHLYNGDYLPEDLYEDWTQKKRERLRRFRCWLLEHAATLAIEQRMGLRACEYLQTLLEHDNTDEQTQRLLMLVYARMGHRADALNQFHQFQTLLRTELNTSPLPETMALFRDIQNGRIPSDLALSQGVFELVSSPSAAGGNKESISPLQAQTAPHQVERRQSREVESKLGREKTLPDQEDALSITIRTPLIGREGEMQRLRSFYTQPYQGQQRICFISGEPGIGKTRLASDFASWAKETQDAQVLWGHCYEMSTALPYQPIVDVIETHARSKTPQQLFEMLGGHASDLAKIVSEIRVKLPNLPQSEQREPETERYNLYSAVAHYFRMLAAEHPLVIILDDVQWADVATFQLLSYLTSRAYHQTRDAVPFYMLLYRAHEIHEKHPLRDLLAAFSHLSNLQEIHLKRLDEKAVQQLVAHSTGYPQDADFANQIYKYTEGNPFFVGQILLSLIQEGKVKKSGEHWQVSVDIDELTLPQSIRLLIERRLAHLSPASRTTLMTAAILGCQFSSVLLCKACNLTEEVIAQHVDDAIQLQILEPLPPQTKLAGLKQSESIRYTVDLAFTHDKIREVLYQGLNPLRRRTLHRQAAQAIEALYGSCLTPYYSTLALHYQMAEEDKYAIDYHLKASKQAFSVYAFHDAANHMENVLALLIGEDEQAQRAEILHQLASETYLYLGLTDKSMDAGLTACALWHDLGNVVKEAEAHLDVAFALHWQGQEMKSLASIEHALECLGCHQEETRLLAKAHSQWGMAAVSMGDTATALEQFQHAEEFYTQAGKSNDPFIEVVTLWSRSWYAFLTGTAHEMLTYAQRGAEVCQVQRRPGWEPMMTYAAAWAYMLQGNVTQGELVAQETLKKAQKNNVVGAQAWAFLVQTFLAIQSSQWQCAQQYSDNALTLARTLRDLDLQARILWSRSILAGWLNDWKLAIDEITEALRLSQQSDSPSMVYPHFLVQAAEAHLSAGHIDKAQQYLDQGMDLSQKRQYRQLPALGKRIQGRILVANGEYFRARDCFEQSLKEFMVLKDLVEYARTLEVYGQWYCAESFLGRKEQGQRFLTRSQEIFQQLGLKGFGKQ